MSYPSALTSPSEVSASHTDSWAVYKSTEAPDLRADLKREITNRVYYNRSEVLDSLFVALSPNALSNDTSVIECVVSAITNTCAGDITALRNIVLDARGGGRGDKTLTAYEAEMYPHLAKIFRTIETAYADEGHARPYFRQLVPSLSKTFKSDDPLLPEFLPSKPDFLVAEVPPPFSGTTTEVVDAAAQLLRCRQCPAFLEVKVLPSDGPVPALNYKNPAVKDALAQGADYARVILSSRPFQLHVFGIFISGTNLCVGRFDRRGVALSPEFDMFSDSGIRNMVSIVLKLTWDMSPVELGHDPTVSLLDSHTYYNETYPRFLVKMSTSVNSEAWRTVGLPLWSSHSLFGRGTSVWRAVRVDLDTAQILKVAWRSASRTGEAEIYQKIKRAFNHSIPRGIATSTSGGGDVHYSPGQPVSVFNLRLHSSLCPTTGPVTDAILHRVPLNDFGKPIWWYRDSAQFIGAISTVVQATEKLHEVGIVHRDISGGNVLIKMKATYKPKYEVETDEESTLKDELIEETELDDNEGFLTDFEFASFAIPSTMEVSRAAPGVDHGRTVAEVPSQGERSRLKEVTVFTPEEAAGDGMAGTPAFMATSLLEAIQKDKTITRSFAQDVESIAYVILCSLYKHAVEDSQVSDDLREELSKEFAEFFPAPSIKSLLYGRALKFSRGAHKSMPNLLVYLRNDAALNICAAGTFNFLSHLFYKA